MTPADKRWGATFLTLGLLAATTGTALGVITAAAAIITGAYILLAGCQR